MRIGLISDTHGFLDESVFEHFRHCDEIWHAGDIGNIEVVSRLEGFKPTKAVFGNIDDDAIRLKYPEHLHFQVEGLKVWITHIGGTPPRYNKFVKPQLVEETPDIFVCGHSHILKVITDSNLNGLLYLNPGAAGQQGFHRMRTLLRFDVTDAKVHDMQVIELGKRGVLKS